MIYYRKHFLYCFSKLEITCPTSFSSTCPLTRKFPNYCINISSNFWSATKRSRVRRKFLCWLETISPVVVTNRKGARSWKKSGANRRASICYQRPRAPISDFIVFHIQSYETSNGSNWRDGDFGNPREPRMARHSANPVPYLVSRSDHHFLRIL